MTVYNIDDIRNTWPSRLNIAYDRIQVDRTAGLAEMEEIAQEGSVDAMIYAAGALSDRGASKEDIDRAIQWYRAAEVRGWPPASHRIGRLEFHNGNMKAALDAFGRGDELKYVPSTFRLGLMYKDGPADLRDADKAMVYLKKASDGGHLFAKRTLALMYMQGKAGVLGVPKGVLTLVTIWFDLIKIAFSGEFKNESFDDRTVG